MTDTFEKEHHDNDAEDATTAEQLKAKKLKSRYLSALRHSWDSTLELQDTTLAFREALITMKQDANKRANRWEQELYEVLQVHGSTRDRNSADHHDKRDVAQRDKIEEELEKWTKIQNRCWELLNELDEHVGGFTDAFINQMKLIVKEASEAPWKSPHEEPWETIRHFHNPQLLELAREVRPVTIDSTCFHVSCLQEFDPVNKKACGTTTHKEQQQHRMNFSISCCCVDPDCPIVNMVYVGTTAGAVLGIPFKMVMSESGTGGASLRRALMDTESASEGASKGIAAAGTSSCEEGGGGGAGEVMIVFRGHVYAVHKVTLLSNGSAADNNNKLLISMGVDKTVRISNAATGVLVNVLVNNAGMVSDCGSFYSNASNNNNAAALCGGALLVSCSYDGLVSLWDTKIGQQSGVLARLKTPLHSMYIEKDSNVVFVGGRNGHIYGLAVNSKKKPSNNKFTAAGSSSSMMGCDCCFAFLPQSATPLIPSGECGTIAYGEHRSAVTSMTYIANFLFSGDREGMVLQWDTVHPACVRKFHGHTDDITGIRVSEDGFLFTASRDALVIVWHMLNGTILQRIKPHYHEVTGFCIGIVPSCSLLLPAAAQEQQQPQEAASTTGGEREAAAAPTTAATATSTAAGKGKENQTTTTTSSSEGAALEAAAGQSKSGISINRIPKGCSAVLVTCSKDQTIAVRSLFYDSKEDDDDDDDL